MLSIEMNGYMTIKEAVAEWGISESFLHMLKSFHETVNQIVLDKPHLVKSHRRTAVVQCFEKAFPYNSGSFSYSNLNVSFFSPF